MRGITMKSSAICLHYPGAHLLHWCRLFIIYAWFLHVTLPHPPPSHHQLASHYISHPSFIFLQHFHLVTHHTSILPHQLVHNIHTPYPIYFFTHSLNSKTISKTTQPIKSRPLSNHPTYNFSPLQCLDFQTTQPQLSHPYNALTSKPPNRNARRT